MVNVQYELSFTILFRIHEPTMMLLMGMWINRTKNPINPIMANPIAVAIAIFWNSFLSGFVHLFTSLRESFENCLAGSTNCITWSIAVGFQVLLWRKLRMLHILSQTNHCGWNRWSWHWDVWINLVGFFMYSSVWALGLLKKTIWNKSFGSSIVHKPPVLVSHRVLFLYDPHKVASVQGQVHQICC